ncbi:GtrA family protein [Loktanella sp. S4079]|uniref:GtrA family protein n=1 Tax=Loktanella sp. S4079 TaxID=579483 RepID=UPI0005F9C902|nr:GtrA family protein [Loktanella sp. S4079]KJZ18635.1 hypothetical protein TW80_14655 [Loktanella sp. S4079]
MARITRDAIVALLNNQLIRFGLVGLANTIFSYGVYATGVYLGLAYYIASLVALLVGIVVSFFMQGRLVFRAQLSGRFSSFLVMWGLLYLLNIGLIRLFVTFGMDYYFAGLLAAVPVVVTSFILQKLIVFKG